VNKGKPKSIRFRLTAWYTGILAATFCVAALGVALALHESTRKTIDKDLRARLATVRVYIDKQTLNEGMPHLLEELDEQAVMTPAATNLRIADSRGRWIYRSPGTEDWPVGPPNRDALPLAGRTQTIQVNNRALRIISAPVKIGAVQIGVPLEEFQEMEWGFLWTTAIGAPLLLALAWLGGFWISGRALRPVLEIARAAGRISSQNLSERLPGTGAGDELDKLSAVLNDMLDRLESGFKRITQFTADASHELRTPIAIIRTTADVTQARKRTLEEHQDSWTVVQVQAERTTQLIADLLTLARADSGLDEFEFEPLNVAQLVRDCCTQIQVLAEAKGLTLNASIVENVEIRADADALHRALLIFLENAVKFTPAPGKVEISMTLAKNGSVVIDIADTGIGIPADDLPRIFERFYRAAKDRSRHSGGAGLGLSIAKSIITRHGGNIDVQSAVGCGSTFRITLPGEFSLPPRL
jgi:heavy metal sensor kinase